MNRLTASVKLLKGGFDVIGGSIRGNLNWHGPVPLVLRFIGISRSRRGPPTATGGTL
jgi:hypothetical protein